MFIELEGGGKAKIHPVVQTPPPICHSRLRRTSKESHFYNDFQCQRESKGPESQLSLSKNDGYYSPLFAVAIIFFMPPKYPVE